MIIHNSLNKSTHVRVINSRLPVYKKYYGDGIGDFFAGMAPKVIPFAKELGMKAINVIRDKGISAVGNLTGKAFSAMKDKIVSMVKKRKQKITAPLPSTAVMPKEVSKVINNAVDQRLASLAMNSLSDDNIGNANISSIIAGSGLKR